MGRSVYITAICCQMLPNAVRRVYRAYSTLLTLCEARLSVGGFSAEIGDSVGEKGVFWRTVVALVGAGERPREDGPMSAETCGKGRGNGGRRELVLSASRVNAVGGCAARHPKGTGEQGLLRSLAVA